jgi:predicted RNase H-like nuclease
MTALVGLDLAWTGHHPSGVCVLRVIEDRLRLETLETRIASPDAFADWLTDLDASVVVAIDAPLVRSTACDAERQLGRAFARFHASAYMATPDFLSRHGLVAGPALGTALAARGWSVDPAVAREGGRVAFEMYPHAFHIVTFGLDRRLAYKKGRLEARRTAFATYQEHLRATLQVLDAELAAEPRIVDLLAPAALSAGARALKDLEDRLDALTCALAAAEAWRHGIAAADIFGTVRDGYIAIPGIGRRGWSATGQRTADLRHRVATKNR